MLQAVPLLRIDLGRIFAHSIPVPLKLALAIQAIRKHPLRSDGIIEHLMKEISLFSFSLDWQVLKSR